MGQNLYFSDAFSSGNIYHLTIEIPKKIFNPDYPDSLQTFGDHIRSARMDADMQIKELARIIGATEDSVINWELRGIRPVPKYFLPMVRFILDNLEATVTRRQLVKLYYSGDPQYPKRIKTIGDKLRVVRLENAISIRKCAKKLGVDQSTIAGWEIRGRTPIPRLMQKVERFIRDYSKAA